MVKWILEPGHTAVEFRVKHMMITFVRGYIKDVHGEVSFDPENPKDMRLKVKMELRNLFTGESARDKHLLSEDFFYAEKYPEITFESIGSKQLGLHQYELEGDVVIRGVKKRVKLFVDYQGQWKTPYYAPLGPPLSVMRIGFRGGLSLNRIDFGVSWNSPMEKGGWVVGEEVLLKIDAEALLESDLKG